MANYKIPVLNTGLTPSRLVASNANKELISSDLASWVTGSGGVDVIDDADGTVTLSMTAGDLTAIEAIAGNLGILKKTAANTWSLITDESANWNTAYTDRNKWDGGDTGLTAATGRTSLGLSPTNTPAFLGLSVGAVDNSALYTFSVNKIITDTTGFLYGLVFEATLAPAANATTEVYGGLFIPKDNAASYNRGKFVSLFAWPRIYQTGGTMPQVISYYSYPQMRTGSAGTIASLKHFFADDVTRQGGGNEIITEAFAFYEAGQTKAVTNWGLAVNTQSYVNGNLRVGSAVVPTVALDVTGTVKVSAMKSGSNQANAGATAKELWYNSTTNVVYMGV